MDTVSFVNEVFSVVSVTVIDCSVEDQCHTHELPLVHSKENMSGVDICHDLLPLEGIQMCENMTTFPSILTYCIMMFSRVVAFLVDMTRKGFPNMLVWSKLAIKAFLYPQTSANKAPHTMSER